MKKNKLISLCLLSSEKRNLLVEDQFPISARNISKKLIFSAMFFLLCLGVADVIRAQPPGFFDITFGIVAKTIEPIAVASDDISGVAAQADGEIKAPPSDCTYSLSATSANFGAAGGTGSFNVITENGCTFNATSNDWFIIITSGNGPGSGTVNYNVLGNNGAARTGTISVNGQIFTINQTNQTAECHPSVVFSSSSFSHLGGNGNLSINFGSQCSYTVTSSHDFITINNGTGTGSGTVNFSIAPNPGSDRLGSIVINGFLGYTITQTGGCSVFLNTTSTSFSPNGGNGSIPVTINDGCPFSVEVPGRVARIF